MSSLTPAQQTILTNVRNLCPPQFLNNVDDKQILAYANLVVTDINIFPPETGWTIDTAVTQPNVANLTYFGCALFADLFLQQNATLQDFNYNDNGLTVQVDQVGKIEANYRSMLEMYRMMITNYKKTQITAISGAGLSSPRVQSQLGQFLKIALGSAFTWGSP